MSCKFLKYMCKSLTCLCLDAILMHFPSVLKKDLEVSDMKYKHHYADD